MSFNEQQQIQEEIDSDVPSPIYSPIYSPVVQNSPIYSPIVQFQEEIDLELSPLYPPYVVQDQEDMDIQFRLYNQEQEDMDRQGQEDIIDHLDEFNFNFDNIIINKTELPEECFDLYSYDFVNSNSFLKELDENIIFLYDNNPYKSSCFSKEILKNIINDRSNWLYECIGPIIPNTNDRAINVNKDEIYLKFPLTTDGFNSFIPLKQIVQILKSNNKYYYITEFIENGTQKMITHSVNWNNVFGNNPDFVSSNHCQSGSNILIYNIKKCTIINNANVRKSRRISTKNRKLRRKSGKSRRKSRHISTKNCKSRRKSGKIHHKSRHISTKNRKSRRKSGKSRRKSRRKSDKIRKSRRTLSKIHKSRRKSIKTRKSRRKSYHRTKKIRI
jgi:hypothetical protein